MIELTEDQAKILESQQENPARVRNPRTAETFVLLRQDVYELVRKIIDGLNRAGWDDPSLDEYEKYRTQQ